MVDPQPFKPFTPLEFSQYGPVWLELWTQHVTPAPGSAAEWALKREFCRRLHGGEDQFSFDIFLVGEDHNCYRENYKGFEREMGRQLVDAFCAQNGAKKLRHMCRAASAMASLSFTAFAVLAFRQLYDTSAAFRARPNTKALRRRMNRLRRRFRGDYRECSDRNWRDVLKTLGPLFNPMEFKPSAPACPPAPRFRYLVVAEASELPVDGQPDDVCIAEDTKEGYLWDVDRSCWVNFGRFPLRAS